ncbi:MAG: TerB N-terminal domain-containing protein, partial [Clostridia bacterium]|nr:TerB N-terminal domain-containing protein [Clostridia bacterium]
MDTKALIEKILRDTKLLQSKSMEGRVYTDEPILHTAAQMARYLPEKYREMRRIATEPEARLRSEEWIFCRQGRFMEDYEDDYSYNGDFVRYFPTYQAMSDTQLRGYFSWRTKLRRGEPEPTSLSFLYVYIYELLNQIGVSSPEAGFRQLNTFWQYYRRMEPQLDRYLPLWLMDYAVYYGLEPEVLESFETVTRERAMADLLHADRQDTEALFEALCTLSTHNLCRSGFYKEHPEDVKAVTCAVFRRLMEHHEKRCKNTLFEKLFGHRVTVSYRMFGAAVFYDIR